MPLPSSDTSAASPARRKSVSLQRHGEDTYSSSGGDASSSAPSGSTVASTGSQNSAYSAHVSSATDRRNYPASSATTRSNVSSSADDSGSSGAEILGHSDKNRRQRHRSKSVMATDNTADQTAVGRATEEDGMPPHAFPSTPSSPRFRIASALTSPYSSGQAEVQGITSSSSSATASRRSAGAWRASRMQQGRSTTPQLNVSGSNSPRKTIGSETETAAAIDINSHFADDEEHDNWEDWARERTSAVTPPGAMTKLPSMSARMAAQTDHDAEAPWVAPQLKRKSTDYDWASFVYAYGRGKWDPARLPQPPGQSNLYPGSESRIGARFGDIIRPLSPERPEESVVESVRRPSIDYIPGVPGLIHRQLSEPDRRSSIVSVGSPSLPAPDSSERAAPRERAMTAVLAPASGLDEGRVDAGEAARQQHTESNPIFVDPFTLLDLASSSSAPQVGQATALAEFAQHLISSDDRSQKLVQRGSKTDSQLITRSALPRLPSDPTYEKSGRSAPHSQPSAKQNGESQPSRSTSAVAATRPALAAQMSEMTISGSHTSRGYETGDELRGASGSSSPPNAADRPRPTPMQKSGSKPNRVDDLQATPRKAAGSSYVALGHNEERRLADILHEGRSEKGEEPEPEEQVRGTLSVDSSGRRVVDLDTLLSQSTQQPETKPGAACVRLLPHRLEESQFDKDIDQGSPSHSAPQQMPGFLAKMGQSNSSPSISTYISVGRSVETFYRDYGYLPGIMPPDEAERRQALRRYGPPRLRGDSNFERIAHLVKLVFNTKLVLVSLVGEKTQFFQTEVGASSLGFGSNWLQQIAASRDCSLCAHAILQPADEPLVVLDAQRDWRFAGNPLVVGDPHIRFYAGSPLRTSDGFNLGSLCIIDDKPWTEFGPRQRHTLREFARVAMREMELVRDTIHLRTQDRMQHSIELFTRKCIEMESNEADENKEPSQGLHQVYALAAKSMCDALHATGAVLFDLSHFELVVSSHNVDSLDDQEGADGGGSQFTHEAVYQYPDQVSFAPQSQEEQAAFNPASVHGKKATEEHLVPPMAVLGSCETLAPPLTREQNVPVLHYMKIADFLRKHRTGSFFPFTPLPFRHLLPAGMSNVLLVPIFGLNRQPFALLCAYSRHMEDGATLEDIQESGLQYLRAMGTIILSAILKKDIMLADKAKSHFISNISHELRTPLHGILAAAELLAETKLNATQGSYLETVEACGKSLLELVNHVLDFTKLSGNVHSKQLAVKPTQQCDLVKLIQEVCESSWIGQMAKNLDSQQHAGIGSAYAKGSETSSIHSRTPEGEEQRGMASLSNAVETVIDVSMRQTGWLVNCDAGGIRRVLMNLIGNSLKFTTQGFVHVSLREVQSTDTHVLIELGVTDTGKGISRNFLEEQLFHPFTQENHLGPGTGLGLSIVNSIVQSPAINGKIDVWSTVGQGTEIRVTCELELSNPAEAEGTIYQPVLNVEHQRSITFLGFVDSMRGQSDLRDVMRSYYEDWWRFTFTDSIEEGDIILINDDYQLIRKIIELRSSPLPPVILLASARGSAQVTRICDEYQKAGGVVRQLFKPAGPAKLEAVTDFCLQCFERGYAGLPMVDEGSAHSTPLPSPAAPSAERLGGDYFTNEGADDADGETPRGQPVSTGVSKYSSSGVSPGPRPRPHLRPKLSNDLRRNSHHISPAPPTAKTATALLRRHSSEGRKQTDDATATVSEQEDENDIVHASLGGGGSKNGAQSRSARPLLPARSITYHEPRLQRHVLMSPLRSPHYRRGDGSEPPDYFGTAATSSLSANAGSGSMDASLPSSPGSVISLEGGEGAVLRSAVHNAGLVRNPGGPIAQQKKRLQILSVEDNSINRRVLAAFFGKMDVDLVEATNGEEGVRAFEAHPAFHFDVIFMDLSMPVLDGIGAMLQIRKIEADRFRAEQNNAVSWMKGMQQQSRTATGGTTSQSIGKGAGRAVHSASMSPNSISALLSTPGGTRPSAQARAKIFALTGRSSEEDKRRAFSTGADGFIVKPLSFKVLSALIATISAYK